jgi:putrescine transport system ATP-binding protein
MSVPCVVIEAASKRYGDVAAVDRVSLEVAAGELFSLLGGSGSGKTTLLRMVAGFVEPSAGRIAIDGVDMAGVPPHRRPVNMMFQSYALFPHMSVARNIGYGLRQAGVRGPELARQVDEALALVQLGGFGQRRPDELSGGQRQRVALARSLVMRPRVLLLDEPMGALDRKLREETRRELVAIQRQVGITFLMVTHDQEEAMGMADRIAVMHAGRIAQLGTPVALYRRPTSRLVAEFVGAVNLLAGRVVRAGPQGCVVESGMAGCLLHAPPTEVAAGQAVWVALRPEDVVLRRGDRLVAGGDTAQGRGGMEPDPGVAPGAGEAGGHGAGGGGAGARANEAAGLVEDVSCLGPQTLCQVTLVSGHRLRVSLHGVATVAAGERVRVSWASGALAVLLR